MKRIPASLREAALAFDRRFGTSIKAKGGHLYRHLLRLMSPLRRILDPALIRFRYRVFSAAPRNLRLHLGCGRKHFDGYVNVDVWITDATDVICDITRLPWPNGSMEVVESYHVIEHISHRKVRDTLLEWFRILRPGGKMILECPHFDQAVREYLTGNETRLINVFGWQRSYGDAHLFGYNPERLTRLLAGAGFADLRETPPQSSQSLDEPSFRIECMKPFD